MAMDPNWHGWTCYYQQSPTEKTLQMCKQHGLDHGAYGWCPLVDPRWTDEQKAAYVEGYEYEREKMFGPRDKAPKHKGTTLYLDR